jgi:hypothetical protein
MAGLRRDAFIEVLPIRHRFEANGGAQTALKSFGEVARVRPAQDLSYDVLQIGPR